METRSCFEGVEDKKMLPEKREADEGVADRSDELNMVKKEGQREDGRLK